MKAALLAMLVALTLPVALSAAGAEQEVLAALNAWKEGTIRKDVALLSKVLHADLTYTHSSGLEQTKADNLKAVAAPNSRTQSIDLSHTTVRVFGDTAIVKTDADVTSGSSAAPTTSHLILLHVFVKTPDGWQMIARQATKKEK
jgi:ketosteroid isomerase-like protein